MSIQPPPPAHPSSDAMPHLALRVLGAFEIRGRTTGSIHFSTDKTRALLAYLAVEPTQPHRRETLANLLWPEMSSTLALNNLRLTLHRLRQALALPDEWNGLDGLHVTRRTVQLDTDAVAGSAAVWSIDVRTFQSLLAECAAHAHAHEREHIDTCPACLARLAQAADLYRGELMAGFGLYDATEFEEWLLLRREMLHQQVLSALSTLARAHEQAGRDALALDYASREIALDPLREEAHRRLMRLYIRRGQPNEAMAQFERCRQLLQEQLHVEPEPETVALIEQIRNPSLRPAAPPNSASAAPPVRDWNEAPEVVPLFGRTAELAQLKHWLTDAPSQPTHLIAVLGMGGVGKTLLTATAVRAVAPQFNVVLWRSLINAPPAEDTLRAWLQTLSGNQLVDLPASLDAQLDLLLAGLRQSRCLLVLDNLESILQPDQAGQLRPGYEGYGRILQWVAEHDHHSRLVLTSRERPSTMARYEHDAPRVRLLSLDGLDDHASQAMLSSGGLHGSDAATLALVQRYSGHPLALKLVAQTVHELFSSDIAAFLSADALIFDDIRDVLDQQFGRLSALEQEILIWLAIEREPVTVQQLRENLVQPPAPRLFMEALRALHRRSLLSTNARGLSLQNVIMEYLTEYWVSEVCQLISAANPADSHILQRLNQFALFKAQARDYVRVSQHRLILEPIASRLLAHWGLPGLVNRLGLIPAGLRARQRDQATPLPGYAAGNVLNLLLHLGADLRGYDFSGLAVRQAYLQGARLPAVNFRAADFVQSVFTQAFDDISAICFDEAGQLLVAGLTQNQLNLWRAADGQLLHTVQGFGAGASIASFSRQGRLLVSGHTDREVRVWDVSSGDLLHTLSGHAETPWALVFSADSTLVATSGSDGVVRVWSAETGQLWARVNAHTAAVPALAFSPDGQFLASGDVDGTIHVWRIQAGQTGTDSPDGVGLSRVYTLHGHEEEVHVMAFDASGTILVSGSHDCTLRLWDAATGESIRVLRAHRSMIRSLAMSPDGRTVASGGGDQFVCLWDIHTGRLMHSLTDLVERSATLAFSADGRTLANVGIDQSIGLWEVETGQRLSSLQVHSNTMDAIAFSPDGQMLASGGTDRVLRIWDVSDLSTRSVSPAPRVSSVRVMTSGKRRILSVAFSPDGRVLASAGNEPTIQLWDTHTSRSLGQLNGHTDDVESVQFSPDGTWLASAGRDADVRIWDVSTRQELRILHGHTRRLITCSISADGRMVASGGLDRAVNIWDAGSGALRHSLQGHTNAVKCVTFSPMEPVLASSSFDQTALLWDAHTGRLKLTLPIPKTIITSIAFHPDGTLLATGATNHSVFLWEVATGRLLQTLRGHANNVESIQFSRDGRLLASGGKDNTICLWDVDTALAGGEACLQTLRADGPYTHMNIAGVTGISEAQKAVLMLLGAVM